MSFRTQANARIGLLGNPSDGYFGRTIACAIGNFAATVELRESERVTLIPHPEFDPYEFDSIEHLHDRAARDGYYGGLRLLFAACKKFAEYCRGKDVTLPARNFTISYDTNIPRQVGLAGSSAIITATFRALRKHYGVTDRELPKEIQPNVVLSVEEDELDIRAGLQDRVAQTYGGLVYMDFDRDLLESRGYGEYEPLDPALLPPLFLAYISKPKDSGKAHSDVRERWKQGDQEVVNAMKQFGDIASEGKQALLSRDFTTFADLMNKNFDLRRRIFGDAVIGAENLELVRIARDNGAPAKFSGSCGAVVGLYRDEEQLTRLRAAYTAAGHSFIVVEPAPATA